jgi:very-short-patch-repair endonuclease
MLALLRKARLPEPETNARVGTWEVDALWRKAKLVVEIDGYTVHSTRRSFERDRRKDRDLQALGYTVLRFTWRELTDEPEAIVAAISRALALR